MKYFILTHNMNLKEMGYFPQTENFKVYGTIREYGKNSKIIEAVTLPEPILFSKARASTYLTGVINSKLFLTVKNYFVEDLSQFKIDEYQTWKIKVHHKGKILNDYSLFHLSNPMQNQYVDYAKSEFYIGKSSDWKYRGKTINVASYEKFLSLFEILHDDGYWLKSDHLVFNFSTATEDLIRLTEIPFGHGYYVSERLKNAIEKERFTGMAFKEIEQYNKKIEVIY